MLKCKTTCPYKSSIFNPGYMPTRIGHYPNMTEFNKYGLYENKYFLITVKKRLRKNFIFW